MNSGDVTYSMNLDAGPFERVIGDLEARALRFGTVLNGALRAAVVDGRDLENVLRGVADRLRAIALDAALKPLDDLFGMAASTLIEGTAGRIVPFAKGGVVSAPTYFPMGDDTGLMGEAGAEAILPLSRGSDGRLGVATRGEARFPAQIVFNVTARDAASFQKSEAQITAMLARAVGRGRRGL